MSGLHDWTSGFLGSMADLFAAIEQDATASVRGEDNLRTPQTVLACYRWARERRSVRPAGISR